MFAAMVLNLLLAALTGALVPMALRRIGQDPALGSSIILTGFTDSFGFLIFLGLAASFLGARSTLLPGESMTLQTTDFLIIGGGIIGISIALEAKRRFPDCRVTLLEKEPHCGLHASGRNSGVLHAGFYYSADSLKARLTREGNRRLTSYCRERGLRLNPCGKLVVATQLSELEWLDELLRRAQRNGVELQALSTIEAREIEPRARVVERALYSPTTSSVDPSQVMTALVADAGRLGVDIRTGLAWRGRTGMVYSPPQEKCLPATSSTPRVCRRIASRRTTVLADAIVSCPSRGSTCRRGRGHRPCTRTSTRARFR